MKVAAALLGAALDGKKFQVILAGNPFRAMPPEEAARRLLPVMQANKPRINFTFTYEMPAEKPHPDFQLYLVFNAANDLGSSRVCEG
jgi:LmbE family N-acetylglucosaminyl deacetylase